MEHLPKVFKEVNFLDYLKGFYAFGNRLSGAEIPDLSSFNPKELWEHWSSFGTLMQEILECGNIYVSYNNSQQIQFIPNKNNYHQALALACFMHIKPKNNELVKVSGPHSHGLQFSAFFRKKIDGSVEYITEVGIKHIFTFVPYSNNCFYCECNL